MPVEYSTTGRHMAKIPPPVRRQVRAGCARGTVPGGAAAGACAPGRPAMDEAPVLLPFVLHRRAH